MKRILLLGLLAACAPLFAQTPSGFPSSGTPIESVIVTSDPSGACFIYNIQYYNPITNRQWACVNTAPDQFLSGTWTQVSAGSGATPGGSSNSVQFNNGGAFGGIINTGAKAYLYQTSSGAPAFQSTPIPIADIGAPIFTASGNIAITGTWPNLTFTVTGGSGSGTVNAGTVGQFAYYSANGTAVGGHTLAASDIEGALTFTPQNSASANANNAGIGNCPSGEFMTGTAAGATQPCATPSVGTVTYTNVTGGTSTYIPFFNASGDLTQSSNFLWNGTALSLYGQGNTIAGYSCFLCIGHPNGQSTWLTVSIGTVGGVVWSAANEANWVQEIDSNAGAYPGAYALQDHTGSNFYIWSTDHADHNFYIGNITNPATGAGAEFAVKVGENGHIYTHGSAPTPSVCTLSFGNDHAGEAGMSAAGNCTLTWATPYASTNYMVQLTVTPASAYTGIVTKTASALTITTSAAATIDYDIVAVN